MVAESLYRLRRDFADVPAEFPAEPAEEAVDEQQQVVAPVAERRQVDVVNAQPVVEVRPESPLG